MQETRNAFATVKTAKSFGTESLRCFLLKTPLLVCSIHSLKQVVFPTHGKLLELLQFSKKEIRPRSLKIDKYRSCLSSQGSYEKFLTNQLYQYLNDNGHYSSGQSGFLRLHSTVTCLLKNTDDWYNGIDLGKLVGLVYIDLKKAFDTVETEQKRRKMTSSSNLR